MDLRQLETFMRVAELGSFTQASHVMGIAQPALSRQVRLLEVELRQTLLDRNGRGVTTTPAGKLLLEHCRGILHQVARAREDLDRVQGAVAGRIALGMPPSASRMLAVHLTRQFREQLPKASLSIVEGLSLLMQEWLLTGRLDVALLYNPSPSDELALCRLTSERLYLVGRRGGEASAAPIPLRMLADTPLVIPNRPHTVRMLLETAMAMIGQRPQIQMEIDSVAAILDLVAHGVGHAVLTEHAMLTATLPERYQLRQIVEPEVHSRLFLATAATRTTTRTQQAVQELVRAAVRQAYPPALVEMD